MLWPPGYGAKELLWARRYVVLAIAGIAFTFSAQSLLLPATDLRPAEPRDTTTARVLVDGSTCQNLRMQHATGATSGAPCGKSFRMKAGMSLAADQPLQRGTLITSQGTLTSADLAITPPKALRTSIWEPRPNNAQAASTLAQTPKQK
ncbi:MAG: hypothetical protein ACI89J_002848 [Hyphomicrobiaceae bacterium]|jgi:hypothetical protein